MGGILESFDPFLYNLTSINREVRNGGLNVSEIIFYYIFRTYTRRTKNVYVMYIPGTRNILVD